MADLSITATNVITATTASANYGVGTAGVAITAGQALYLDSTANTLKLCINSGSSAGDCVGIALHAAGVSQPIKYQTSGDITIGATIVAGQPYINSTAAGGICTVADIGAGQYVKVLLMGRTTAVASIVNVGPNAIVAHG